MTDTMDVKGVPQNAEMEESVLRDSGFEQSLNKSDLSREGLSGNVLESVAEDQAVNEAKSRTTSESLCSDTVAAEDSVKAHEMTMGDCGLQATNEKKEGEQGSSNEISPSNELGANEKQSTDEGNLLFLCPLKSGSNLS